MNVHVKLSTSLRAHAPGYEPAKGMDLDASGATAYSLAQRIGLPLEEIKFVMINGRQLPLETKLANGDRVAYFPAVGGG